MLRIFFTSDDIARTRVLAAPDPLWETALSLHALQSRHGEAIFGPWRRAVSTELRRSGLGRQMRLLLALNPPQGYFADFVTPQPTGGGLRSGLESIQSTPADQLRHDLTLLAAENQPPAGASALARGDPEALGHLAGTIEAYYRTALAPYWASIEATVESDRAYRARVVLDGGVGGLLATLRPTMRWGSGELLISYPMDRELHLDGRGLLLVPSYFCWRYPVTLLDPMLPPVLVYPVDRTTPLVPVPAATNPGLGALLGRTRADVLIAIQGGKSTSDIARRVGISQSAASQHATVLRNAGLIVSHRERNTVTHMLTPAGAAMLNHG